MMRLAYFVSHPIQYQAPLLRLIAKDPTIDLKVFFYSDFSLKAYSDKGFGRVIQWDVPLLEGYNYEFLDTWGSKQCKRVSYKSLLAKDILNQLREGRFDVVWVHGWANFCGVQAILAAEKLGIPVLLRGESNGLTKSNNIIKQKIKKIYLKWLFKKVTGFLYIGTLNCQFYKNHGIKDKNLFSMPYSVDNDYFQKKATLAHQYRENFRQSLNLDLNRPIILYAAKLIGVKRPQDLLQAYKLLSQDGLQEPEPYLLFVGDGKLRPLLEEQAKETQWKSIKFTGFCNQSEIAKFYDLCDVFVLPSNFEPWGLAINEVMNASKAILVSDQVGCAHDLIREEINGKIFPTGDVKALAEALRWGINNSISAGDESLKIIQNWSFQEDLKGIKSALNTLNMKSKI